MPWAIIAAIVTSFLANWLDDTNVFKTADVRYETNEKGETVAIIDGGPAKKKAEPKKKKPKKTIRFKIRMRKLKKKDEKEVRWSRQLPAMRWRMRYWARRNPELASTIKVVLGQMDALARERRIFNAVLRDSEFRSRGEESRETFENACEQIRQNFSDIYNLLMSAGAGFGKASYASLDELALRSELDSNSTKLVLLRQTRAEVVRFVNQVDTPLDNYQMQSEIKVLGGINHGNYSGAAASRIVESGRSEFAERAYGGAASGGATSGAAAASTSTGAAATSAGTAAAVQEKPK